MDRISVSSTFDVGSIPTGATFGGLAHLARALAWQARGDRFESGILHKKVLISICFFVFITGNLNCKLALNNLLEIICRYSYLSSFWLFIYASVK